MVCKITNRIIRGSQLSLTGPQISFSCLCSCRLPPSFPLSSTLFLRLWETGGCGMGVVSMNCLGTNLFCHLLAHNLQEITGHWGHQFLHLLHGDNDCLHTMLLTGIVGTQGYLAAPRGEDYGLVLSVLSSAESSLHSYPSGCVTAASGQPVLFSSDRSTTSKVLAWLTSQCIFCLAFCRAVSRVILIKAYLSLGWGVLLPARTGENIWGSALQMHFPWICGRLPHSTTTSTGSKPAHSWALWGGGRGSGG